MREILFRGKLPDKSKWVEGSLRVSGPYTDGSRTYEIFKAKAMPYVYSIYDVAPATVGQYTGLCDKNGKKIFEGDIVEYNTFNDFDCYSIVKIGEYIQDGSGGEYRGRNCNGVYVEVDNFTCPDWADNDPSYFSEYLWQQNLAEVNAECEIIGNIHDNPELLKGAET